MPLVGGEFFVRQDHELAGESVTQGVQRGALLALVSLGAGGMFGIRAVDLRAIGCGAGAGSGSEVCIHVPELALGARGALHCESRRMPLKVLKGKAKAERKIFIRSV